MNRKKFSGWFVIFLLIVSACSNEEQALLATAVSQSEKTVAAGAKTQSPAWQTQIAELGKTAVSEGMDKVKTEAAQVRETTTARIATQAARVQETAEARVATEKARLLATPEDKLPEMDYFALGDSIASGHGLSFSEDPDGCQQSDLSYPYKVKAYLEERYDQVFFQHLACSGATAGRPDAETLRKYPRKWFRNQVDETVRLLSDRPTLITITIGANDAGWSDPISMFGHLFLEDGAAYLNWVNGLKAEISQELLGQIPRLMLDHPNVSIILTQLHNPVNQNSIFFNHDIAGIRLPCTDLLDTLTCYQRTSYLVDGINNGYVLDVFVPLDRPANLRVVPSNALFSVHASPQPTCGESAPAVEDTWIQYPGDPKSFGRVPDQMRDFLTHKPYGDCFHPNEEGAKAIARLVNEYAIRLGK